MDQIQQTGMPVSQPAKSKKPLIIGVLVVIVLVGGYFMLRGGSAPAAPQGIVAGDQNSITIADQDADSVAALIANVQLRQPGFVVIHADNNGQPGEIVGSSKLLQPGNYDNLSVVSKLAPGKTFWAMLHTDDGNGIFDAANDKPTTDNAGAVVMKRFMVKLTSVGGETKG